VKSWKKVRKYDLWSITKKGDHNFLEREFGQRSHKGKSLGWNLQPWISLKTCSDKHNEFKHVCM